MRILRFMLVLAVSVTAVGALSIDAAQATSSLFKTAPTCTVSATSSSSSSTTCNVTLSGNNKSRNLRADVTTAGFAVYQCQNADGTVTAGQNQVRVDGLMSSTSVPTGSHATFTTNPAVLTAPSTVSAQQAGCADGSTVAGPTLTTTSITLAINNGSINSAPCTASDPNGLSGTVALSC